MTDETDENEAKQPPQVNQVVVTARGGFQTLNGVNPAFKAVFNAYDSVANGTAGKVVMVPTGDLPGIFRRLADLLESEFQHTPSGVKVLASAGIDNWVIAIQAVSPTP